MKFIISICSIILPILSSFEFNPKFCVNCKYYIKDNTDIIFSKCSFFPTKKGKIHFLVTGDNYKEDFYSCTVSREINDMCGQDAKMYVPKEKKFL